MEKNAIHNNLKMIRIPLVVTLSMILLFQTILFVGYVPTVSMEPTLKAGSYIFGTRFTEELEVGDIIVFRRDGQLIVKRIAGAPGDKINLSELFYMTTLPIPVWEENVITVPEESYFVLGDNTENSIDSRYWEEKFVKKSDIVAKLIVLQ